MSTTRKLSPPQIEALAALAAGELAYTVAGWSTSRDSIKYFASTTIFVLGRLGYCHDSGRSRGARRVARITNAGRKAHEQMQAGADAV